MKKQQVVVFVVLWKLFYLALLKNIKDNKYKSIFKSNHTRVFNITFIGFLIIQLKFHYKQKKKIALLKGPGN